MSAKRVEGGDKRVTDAAGVTFIPATKRADGTWRKERRVRAGYVPPDEIAAYESRGSRAARQRAAAGPVGMASRPKPAKVGAKPQQLSKNAKRRAAKRAAAEEARKREEEAALARRLAAVELGEPVPAPAPAAASPAPAPAPAPSAATADDAPVDNTKVIRKLRKKLRQLETLEKKVAEGVSLNAEQQLKLDGKAALLEQLAALEG